MQSYDTFIAPKQITQPNVNGMADKSATRKAAEEFEAMFKEKLDAFICPVTGMKF